MTLSGRLDTDSLRGCPPYTLVVDEREPVLYTDLYEVARLAAYWAIQGAANVTVEDNDGILIVGYGA